MDLKVIWHDDMEGVHPAQYCNQWRGPVNTLINYRVSHKVGSFLTSWAPIVVLQWSKEEWTDFQYVVMEFDFSFMRSKVFYKYDPKLHFSYRQYQN
jgi:hypothetical protein